MNVGKFSKAKGKRGELELVHKLQELGFQDAHRSQQYCGSASSADVVGVPGVHIECKRTECFSLYQAFEQAEHDSGSDDIPIVCHRRNGKPWLAILSLENFYKIYQGYLKSKET